MTETKKPNMAVGEKRQWSKENYKLVSDFESAVWWWSRSHPGSEVNIKLIRKAHNLRRKILKKLGDK